MASCFYDYRYVVCLFGASSFLPQINAIGISSLRSVRFIHVQTNYRWDDYLSQCRSRARRRNGTVGSSARFRLFEPVLAAARTRHGHQNLHHGLIVAGKAKGRIAFEGKPCLVGVCSSIAEVKEGVAWAHSVSRSKLIIAERRSRGGALDRINAKLHQPQRANCPHALCPRG